MSESEIPTPPSGFGRQVLLADIVPYAKPGHPACKNSDLGPGSVVILKNGKRIPDACQCAVKRFKKANEKNVEILRFGTTTEVRWKPGCEPKVA